jgi:hypothetical protein
LKRIKKAAEALPWPLYKNLRTLKAKMSPFAIVMRMHAFFELPAMTLKEIKIYKKVITSLPVDGSLNIFEYGSGFSTLYFAKLLKRKKIPFHIYSIDNNLEWHQKVKERVIKNGLDNEITLLISEFPPFWEKEGWDWNVSPECGRFAPQTKAEFDYINAPSNIGRKFDFISVDARFRRLCLATIPQCLKEKGVVFLHDAQKAKYYEPLSLYRTSKFIDGGKNYFFEKNDWKVWIGSLGDDLPL